MKIVAKYLKPFAIVLLVCVALLFAQAMCELSLPNIMSDIVNVGIQSGGISETSPKKLSENGMALMTTFMTEQDARSFSEAYDLTDGVYSQKELLKADAERIGNIYGKAAFAFTKLVSSFDEMTKQGDAGDAKQEMKLDEAYAALPAFSLMKDKLDEAITSASTTDSSIYNAVGTVFTRLFYEEAGLNLDDIRQGYIIQKGLYMLLIALISVIAAVSVGFFASRTGASLAKNLRHDVFARVESFSNNEFDKFSTASLITRTTNDITQVQMLVTMGIRMVCYAPIMGIGGVIMAVNKSVSMTWIIAAAVVAMIGLMIVVFALGVPKFKLLQKLVDRVNLVSREQLSGIMVIRAFGNQRHEEARFDKANDDVRKTDRFVQRIMSFMMPSMNFVMQVVTLAIVWVGGHAIAESTMQIGDMMAFMQYAMQIIMSFLMISMMFIMLPRAAVSVNRIAEVLNTVPEIIDPKKPKHLSLNSVKGEIKFDNVAFRYHNAEDDVIQNVSFTARPGQTTAFIGSTGSGKSTLINLIPRFYDVTAGSITIDGVDLREVPQKELRDCIGYVPQKGVLFSGDIASNIRYGKDNADVLEMNEAIDVAQAAEFVASSEHGLETEIAQGGGNVSGGQKQRLAIARALVKKAPIYIFDDSFSALDFKTDAALRRALHESTASSTVLIVAQRVSTIMNAEQIIVLDEGSVVGIGTHRELLKNCAEYREIAESQLAKEELE